MLRPDSRAGDPLLYHATTTLSDDDLPDRGRKPHRSVTQRSSPAPPTDLHRPILPRRPTTTTGGTGTGTGTGTGLLRSRSPTISLAASKSAARKKYSLAAFFLTISLVTFTVQTLLAAHIQHNLGWNKAYCMLYLTHGSWVLLWPLQLCFLWWFGGGKKRGWGRFWEGQVRLVRATALQIQGSSPGGAGVGGSGGRFGYGSGMMGTAGSSPWGYLVKTTVGVTTALTVAGLSWYVAVSMTTPSDLTAIYNCSAFFAYAFSVPLLKEKLRLDKMVAVAVAIVGVLVVAYGDSGEGGGSTDDAGYMPDPGRRLMGNLVIGAGSVLYGLYEVLYKRFACPPEGTEAARGVIFANAFGSLIGVFTLFVLWIPLPILHVLGWETFEVPTGQTAWLLFISVVMNMMFSGSFLVLISLTSPVLSSVAALLTIFIVAIVDWMWTGTPLSAAAVFGGLLIIVAFGMLSWSTWREMDEEARKKQVDLSGDEDD